MKEHLDELDQALGVVRESMGRKQPLNRYHARAVLLPLGVVLAGASAEQGRECVGRVQALVLRVRQTWDAAVRDELDLAVAEFVQSVDPSYLKRPDYDFRYTVSARERLADRLRAAEALGLRPKSELIEQMVQADRRLQPFLTPKKP